MASKSFMEYLKQSNTIVKESVREKQEKEKKVKDKVVEESTKTATNARNPMSRANEILSGMPSENNVNVNENNGFAKVKYQKQGRVVNRAANLI